MITATCVGAGDPWVVADNYLSLAHAVDDLRDYWDEEDGPQTFVLTDHDGNYLATLARVGPDPEVCLTTYANGDVEWHRCRYLLDREGDYESTLVLALGERPFETEGGARCP